MSGLFPIFLIALIGAVAAGAYFYIKRRSHQRRSLEIAAAPNLLAHWVYSPEEWRRAVEDGFTWVKNKESGGHLYITPTALCVKNDFQERVVELADKGKVVTNASYRGTERGASLNCASAGRSSSNANTGRTKSDITGKITGYLCLQNIERKRCGPQSSLPPG